MIGKHASDKVIRHNYHLSPLPICILLYIVFIEIEIDIEIVER